MYQFNHMTQTFEEVKEATRFERLMRKRVSRWGIIKIGIGGLVVILALGYIMITDSQKRLEKVQHEYRHIQQSIKEYHNEKSYFERGIGRNGYHDFGMRRSQWRV